MTAVSTTAAHADLQLGPSSVTSHLPSSLQNGVTIPESVAQEGETIDCICSYTEDDGSTIFCELCKTWQHIDCYYPGQTSYTLSNEFIHECERCRPRSRPLDKKAARERQAKKQAEINDEKRTKRPKSASHRKKTKDSVQLNGFVAAEREIGIEYRSASPRDQPPPAKRAKTSHRPSASVASLNNIATISNGRRKNGVPHVQSPVRSPPELPGSWDYFSPEFMQLHKKPDYQYADSNSMTSIAVTNDLALWMQDSEELAKVTNGQKPQEVFWRIDTTFQEFEGNSPGVTLRSEEDQTYASSEGTHPVIQRLTINSDLTHNNFIGEIRGQISRRDEYLRDPTNRWPHLRHPEPYVFFSPSLPIVIDAREEGTEMRYIRRSCRPNASLKIIIDKGGDYHCCVISMSDLQESDEITLGWEIDRDIIQMMQSFTNRGDLKKNGGTFRREEEQYLCNWVSGVFANFGGCACEGPHACVLTKFDRRGQAAFTNAGSLKLPKGRKGKKGIHASPLSTGRAVNSRANSEAANAKGESYDDHADSRSTSGSSRSKPTSRDNTPGGNTADEGVSAREKRKIEQLERQFQFNEDNTPARKKKRNSAGSTLNTPGVNTSRQLGLGIDSQNPSPTGILNSRFGKGSASDGANGSNLRHRTSSSGSSRSQSGKMYVDAATQTDTGAQNFYNTELAPPRKTRIPYAAKLLARTRDEKPKAIKVVPRTASATPRRIITASPPTITTAGAPVASMLPPPRPPPTATQIYLTTTTKPEPTIAIKQDVDVEMHDAPSESTTVASTAVDASTSPKQPAKSDPPATVVSPQAITPNQPPPAPWPHKQASPEPAAPAQPTTSLTSPTENSITSERKPSDASSNTSTRPLGLHVDLPPPQPPFSSSPTATTPSIAATPGSVTGASMAQSPLSVTTGAAAPLLSPAITSAIAPSPLKKKVSLSDYLSNRKKKAADAAKETEDTKPLDTVNEGGDSKEEVDKEDGPPAFPQSESTALEEADIPLTPIKGVTELDQAKAAEVGLSSPQSKEADATATAVGELVTAPLQDEQKTDAAGTDTTVGTTS